MAVKYAKVNGEYYLLSCIKCSRFKDCTEKKLAFEIKRSITMDLENIKRGLRAEIAKRENEQYSTFQTNIHDMCRDVLDKLEEQEALINEMKEAAADMGLKWHEYDAGEDAWEDTHKGKWVKA
jgi:cystathionine beta-lyase/cystathionine gamma-synthase